MSEQSELMRLAMARLERALGFEQAALLATQILERIGVRSLATSDELLRFAGCLLEQGGVPEVVGRALKVTAMLRGARAVR